MVACSLCIALNSTPSNTLVHSFTLPQAKQWRTACEAMGSWLTDLCTSYEAHRAKSADNEAAVRETFRSTRSAHDERDAECEAALEAAVTAVTQGYSENELDARVAVALEKLEEIAGGYRRVAAVPFCALALVRILLNLYGRVCTWADAGARLVAVHAGACFMFFLCACAY